MSVLLNCFGRVRHFFGLCLALGLFSLGAIPAWPQATSTSTVTGLVTDQSNAAIVGAEVRLTDPSTNSVQTTITNEAGRYVFVNVPSGTYDIAITKEGFTVYKVNAQNVSVGSVITV